MIRKLCSKYPDKNTYTRNHKQSVKEILAWEHYIFPNNAVLPIYKSLVKQCGLPTCRYEILSRHTVAEYVSSLWQRQSLSHRWEFPSVSVSNYYYSKVILFEILILQQIFQWLCFRHIQEHAFRNKFVTDTVSPISIIDHPWWVKGNSFLFYPWGGYLNSYVTSLFIQLDIY